MYHGWLVCRIVSVGGDGMFSEIVNGLMTRSLKHEGIEQVNIETVLPRPKWRVGIIPAGRNPAKRLAYNLHMTKTY